MPSVWKMDWTEHEMGWGQRPDGCSLHASEEAWERYIAEARAGLPKVTPDIYERPDGEQPVRVPCSEGLAALVEQEGSLRLAKSSTAMAGGVLVERGAGFMEACQSALATAERVQLAEAAGPGVAAPRKGL